MNSCYKLQTKLPALGRISMIMSGLYLVLGLFLMPGLVGTLQAQESPPALRLVADDWCPYNCNPTNPQPGILVEIVQDIFAQHGIATTYQVVPWERAKHLVETGQADAALGLSKTHKGPLLRNSLPLAHDATVLIWRSGEGRPYSGPSVLDGQRIGVGFAYSFDEGGELDQYIAMRRENKRLITVLYQESHLKHLWMMLSSDRIDVIIEDVHALQHLFAKGKPKDLDVGIDSVDISATGITTGLYVGFTPNARGQENARILDEGLARLNDTGKIEAILNKYRGNQHPGIIPLPIAGSRRGGSGDTPARQEK